jgi:hypothetical protein
MEGDEYTLMRILWLLSVVSLLASGAAGTMRKRWVILFVLVLLGGYGGVALYGWVQRLLRPVWWAYAMIS